MSMYGLHVALDLLHEMQNRIIANTKMSSFEKQFQLRSLDALIILVQTNYHEAMKDVAEATQQEPESILELETTFDDARKYAAVKSADELEHEAEQVMSRLEVAFGTESEGDKWN